MTNILEINKSESVAENPTKRGWYLCKVHSSSILHYEDGQKKPAYSSAIYRLKLLYWEDNIWVVDPRSYNTIDKRDILEWMWVPDKFNFWEQNVKINY